MMLNALVRRPIAPAENPPILVLLHGLGANEHDLMGLADDLDPRLLVVTLQAPLKYGPSGYAWFEIMWEANGVRVHPEQVIASRDLLIETLEGIPSALEVDDPYLLIGGFSQGAMMSLGVAFAKPEVVKGVISMSGRLVDEFLPLDVPEALTHVPFLIQHGVKDGVLPVDGSRKVRDYLLETGCEVSYQEYEMAHEISRESLADVRDWIADRLQER